jgi:hypothetical protein
VVTRDDFTRTAPAIIANARLMLLYVSFIHRSSLRFDLSTHRSPISFTFDAAGYDAAGARACFGMPILPPRRAMPDARPHGYELNDFGEVFRRSRIASAARALTHGPRSLFTLL